MKHLSRKQVVELIAAAESDRDRAWLAGSIVPPFG